MLTRGDPQICLF